MLDGDGRATVTYQTRWQASGTMHGFYFEGERATPRFTGGTAELPGRRQVPLAISPVSAAEVGRRARRRRGVGPGRGHVHVLRTRPTSPPRGSSRSRRTRTAGRSRCSTGRRSSGTRPLQHETLVVAFKSVAAPRAGDLTLEDATGRGPAHRAVGQRALQDHVPRRRPTRRSSGCASTRTRSRRGATTACSSTCRPNASRVSPPPRSGAQAEQRAERAREQREGAPGAAAAHARPAPAAARARARRLRGGRRRSSAASRARPRRRPTCSGSATTGSRRGCACRASARPGRWRSCCRSRRWRCSACRSR